MCVYIYDMYTPIHTYAQGFQRLYATGHCMLLFDWQGVHRGSTYTSIVELGP